MTVTAHVYGQASLSLASKQINYLGGPVNVALCDQTYTPNQDTHRFFSDITGEISGGGYVAGGKALTAKTATYDPATHTETLSAADIKWASSSLTAFYAVFYAPTGNPATSALLCYWDFGGAVVSSASDFILSLSSSGLVTVTAN